MIRRGAPLVDSVVSTPSVQMELLVNLAFLRTRDTKEVLEDLI